MENRFYQTLVVLLSLLFPTLLSAQDITEPTEYYLMHSSGNHVAKNAEGRTVLAGADAAVPMKLLVTPLGDGYYTFQAPGNGGYMSLKGKWETWFLDDPTSAVAQYKIEKAGDFFIKLKCRSNNKYLGTDAATAGSSVFSDKSGSESLHHWYLSSDPTATPPATEIAYIINPAAERQAFEGWGVSLCWWANMCGKWSDDKIDEIVDWLVSPDGLNFNIFRYNIGGGDDPDNTNCTAHHMGSGKGLRAEMEGFKDSSDGPYIWSRDAAQRKIMLKIKEKRPDAIFEAFSNSAPYYMTYSGCVAGNKDKSKDNLRPEYYEEFAHYLVDVCKHYKDEYGIEFKTLDPFNEPMTSYWGANGGQEGCHFDVNSQIEMIKVLYPILKASGLNTVISASDETSVAQAVNDFVAYRNAGILDMIGQFNTHTYTADDKSRTKLSALCKEENKHLWMSEVGSGGNGLAGNLGLAQKLIDDVRHLMPAAWIDWQYIEENNDQWCLVKAGSFADGTYEKVKNYSIRSHFSRFIKAGYKFLTVCDGKTIAAISPKGDELVIVSINNGSLPMRHKVGISMFKSVGYDVAAYVTDNSRDIATLDDVSIENSTLTFPVPAMSVVTVVVPVSSESSYNKGILPGEKYIVCPRLAAGLGLDANNGAVKIQNISFDKSQIWTPAMSGDGYTLTNGNGEILTEKSPNYALTTETSPSAGQTFKIEAIDDVFHKVLNGDGTKALDLEGEKSTDGTGVGVWQYDTTEAPTHRQWLFMQLPGSYGLDGIDSPTVSADAVTPIRLCNVSDGVLNVEAVEQAGELRIFNASGMCLFSRKIAEDPITIPLQSGCYIVSFTTDRNFATTVFVK